MLDILDRKTGKVIAVLLDDGTLVKKNNKDDDLDKMIKDKLEDLARERRKG